MNHYYIDLNRNTLFELAKILKNASSLIKTKKKMTKLGTTDNKSDNTRD